MRAIAVAVISFLMMGSLAVGEYEANWDSINSRPVPQWFSDAKLGIFIHWGVYSVPAFAPTDDEVGVYAKYSEWYWKRWSEKSSGKAHEYFKAFHDRVYGPSIKYPDFAAQFKAEMYDPDHWADVFKKSGAKYIVLTSKHHDGFCLWPSVQSWNWNAVDVGPHRDLAGDLTEAVRKKGLRMGFYFSLYEWYNPLYRQDVNRYVDEHMMPQVKDLVMRYKPDVLWGDGEWDHPSEVWKSCELLAWLYNESPVKDYVAVNDRWGKETRSKHGGYYTTEYGLVHSDQMGDDVVAHPWEECRGIGHSFGYNRAETLEHYSSAKKLVHLLVELVSKGGNLLLDIGPTADGRIPVIMEERLTQLGQWLEVNGEAIYGSRPWTKGKKSPTVRFTQGRDNAVYAICLAWPGKTLTLEIPKLPADSRITLLGYDKPLDWKNSGGKVIVDLSDITYDQVPCEYAFAFKIYKK